MAEERTGFLGRWARRKTDVLQGKALDEPAAPMKVAPSIASPGSPVALEADPADTPAPAMRSLEKPEKLLSLDDVKLLTRESDFKPFMARTVGADVRNAAMKKLFTDPHYNVMDGLDIYISDYSIADPIPESMLRQMVGAKLLKIFHDDDEKNDVNQEAAVAQPPVNSPVQNDLNNPTPETVAKSGDSLYAHGQKTPSAELFSHHEPSEDSGASPDDDHAHPHLRLQPDHAPPAEDAGHGTP